MIGKNKGYLLTCTRIVNMIHEGVETWGAKNFMFLLSREEWNKLICAWACTMMPPDSFSVSENKDIQPMASSARHEQYAAEMRERQAIPYNGQWYRVDIT